MSGFGAFTADDSINLLPEVAKLVNNKLISFDHLSALLLFHSFTRADLWPFCRTSHSSPSPFSVPCWQITQCLLNIDRNCLWINCLFSKNIPCLHFWVHFEKNKEKVVFTNAWVTLYIVFFSPLLSFIRLHGSLNVVI